MTVSLTSRGCRRLQHLDLSGTGITDAGLQVLRHLPRLRTISLAWTRVTDEGIGALADCHELEHVNLSATAAGDGALRALAGKRKLHHLMIALSDAGLPLLHELPVFKSWQGGERTVSLLGPKVLPNHLSLRGSFTDRGMRHLRGLDGLFSLDIDDSRLANHRCRPRAAGLASASRRPGRGRQGRLDALRRGDTEPAVSRCTGHGGRRRRVRRAQPIAIDRMHLGTAMSQPAQPRVHGTGADAGAPRAVGELFERGRRWSVGAAGVPGVEGAHADGRSGCGIPSRRQVRAARVADPDVLPRHHRRGDRAHHRLAPSVLLLQQLYDDHGSNAGAVVHDGRRSSASRSTRVTG